ncbi:Uncharacterised protein [Chromobacterium vaccinii]|nr:Uncharacterised protein [Chromobacterium vaccinii]
MRIFNDSLSRKITDTETSPKEGQTLWDFLGTEEGEAIAKYIADYIESIPYDIEIYIPLPEIPKLSSAEIKLADGISLVNSAGDPKLEPLARQTPSSELGIGVTNEVSNRVFLKQRMAGFLTTNPDAIHARLAVSNLKTMIHYGTMLGDFKRKFKSFREIASRVYSAEKLSATCFDAISFGSSTQGVHYPLAYQLCRTLPTVSMQAPFHCDELKNIALLISSNSKDLDAARIKSAIKWDFDSSLDELENPALSLLQICIGLEALLGDLGSQEGVTRTLSDRYAYLLGQNTEERNDIKNNFKELYETRSNIVHGKYVELNDDAKQLLHWGRQLLGRAILKEFDAWLLDKSN